MKKKFFLSVLALILLFSIPVSTAFAGELSNDFSQTTLPNNWTVVKEDVSSTVDVVDGKLKINNISGHTEIRLPDTDMTDFALSFKASRKGGETMVNKDYPSFGIKYYMNQDYTKGYEIKIHYLQRKPEQSAYTDIFWSGANGDKLQTSGTGFEHRIINPDDEENTNKLLTFNYFKHAIYSDIEYNFDITVKDGVMQLWVDGDVWLKDILEEEFKSGKFAIAFDGESAVTIDDFKITTLESFANAKIDALPEILSNQSNDVKREYEAEIIEAEKFIVETFGDNASLLSNYSSFVAKKTALENAYGIIESRIPTLTVVWNIDETLAQGSKIALPVGTAIDQDGTYYYVESTVTFDGKTLKKSSNTVTANEVGEYTVKYVARNALGESAEVSYKFTITADGENVLPVILLIGGIVIFVGAVIANLMLLTRRKKA